MTTPIALCEAMSCMQAIHLGPNSRISDHVLDTKDQDAQTYCLKQIASMMEEIHVKNAVKKE
jgi:hypothetical protein